MEEEPIQDTTKRQSSSDEAGLLKVILPPLIGLIGVLIMAFVTWEVAQVPIRATQTAEARQTQIALTSTAASTTRPPSLTSTPVYTPASTQTPFSTVSPTPSVTPVSLTPPASIETPRCERPANVKITNPINGDRVSGIIEIRGRLKTRGAGGKWYSLYYHDGVVNPEPIAEYHWQVPRPKTSPVEGNVLIKYVDYPPDQEDGVLGMWDTTKLTPGWYTLRVWYEEINAQFLACDVYVLVTQ